METLLSRFKIKCGQKVNTHSETAQFASFKKLPSNWRTIKWLVVLQHSERSLYRANWTSSGKVNSKWERTPFASLAIDSVGTQRARRGKQGLPRLCIRLMAVPMQLLLAVRAASQGACRALCRVYSRYVSTQYDSRANLNILLNRFCPTDFVQQKTLKSFEVKTGSRLQNQSCGSQDKFWIEKINFEFESFWF